MWSGIGVVLLYPCKWNWVGILVFSLSISPSVRPSVCWPKHFCFVSSTILAGSISKLHFLSYNFRRCVHILNFDSLLHDLAHHVLASSGCWDMWGFLIMQGIRYELIVWVIMGQTGVFSEHRHSSCSSWFVRWPLSLSVTLQVAVFYVLYSECWTTAGHPILPVFLFIHV